ncbi:MAG: MATE family efflux transporter [Lachnospiraceae bacterium]|nr:MATE family efflux transporter [Lachnospiraceae bacterium]
MARNDYLMTDKPLKALFVFAMPMIIGNIFQQIYNIADSAIVGRYVSEGALAAVGDCAALAFIYISVAVGAGVGSSVIVSRHFGENDMKSMKTAFSTAFITFLIFSILLAAVSFVFGRPLMVLLKTPADILDMVMEYLQIYFLSLPFLFMYNVIAAMFNALGKSRIPLYFLIFSSLFNIVLDIILVTRFNLGVTGVALATLIAQGLSAVLSFIYLIRIMNELCPEKTPLYDAKEFSAMMRIALPSILQQSTISVGMLIVQVVVNSMGSEVLAGFSAAYRIEQVCIVPMAQISNAMSAYTAQNLGANKPERIPQGLRAALIIDGGFALLWIAMCTGLRVPLTKLFLDPAASAVAFETSTYYLMMIGFFFFIIGVKMAFDGVLRGSGDMTMFTVANLVNLAVRIVITFTFGPIVGIAAIVFSEPVGWFLNALISGLEYRTGKWRRLSNHS